MTFAQRQAAARDELKEIRRCRETHEAEGAALALRTERAIHQAVAAELSHQTIADVIGVHRTRITQIAGTPQRAQGGEE